MKSRSSFVFSYFSQRKAAQWNADSLLISIESFRIYTKGFMTITIPNNTELGVSSKMSNSYLLGWDAPITWLTLHPAAFHLVLIYTVHDSPGHTTKLPLALSRLPFEELKQWIDRKYLAMDGILHAAELSFRSSSAFLTLPSEPQ